MKNERFLLLYNDVCNRRVDVLTHMMLIKTDIRNRHRQFCSAFTYVKSCHINVICVVEIILHN